MNETDQAERIQPDSSGGGTIDPFRAEFSDVDLEREFVHYHLDSTARRVRTTSLLGVASFFAFTVSDSARFGFGRRYLLLLVLRSMVVVATVFFTERVRRRPEFALSWKAVSALESAVLAVVFAVMIFRPGETEVNNLGISVTVVAILMLVPNRYVASLLVSGAAVVIDVGLSLMVGGPTSKWLPSVLTLVTFLVVGAISANQLHRARRDEYVSLRNEQESNDLLMAEIGTRQVLEDELTRMANHDPLTDLLNRRAFCELAEREAAAARSGNQRLSILVIDADEFKSLNDRFGHQSGDEVLCRIAEACKRHLRPHDVVGRIGGEEFAVIMPSTDRELARAVAERLRQAVAAIRIEHPGGPICPSVSIGVTEFRGGNEAMLEGLRRADEGMYLAKATGRNRVVPV